MRYNPHTEKIDYRLQFNSWGFRKRIDQDTMEELKKAEENEKAPSYKIVNFEFNEISRVARITFCETRKYKTIDRYITRNYVKYPLYSDWKLKEKLIKKSAKLNNEGLENLLFQEDPLLKSFAFEIVDLLNNKDLVPSWYNARPQYEKSQKEIQRIAEKALEAKAELESEIEDLRIEMEPAQLRKDRFEDEIERDNNKLQTLLIKLRYNERKAEAIKYKFEKRREAILRKAQVYIEQVDFYEQEIKKIENKIIKIFKDSEKLIKASESEFQKCLKKNKKLKTNFDAVDEDFIPLKNIAGISYKKIVGVYVIHNKEFDKYYVGQSKDVLRRLGQHFKGTKVNNVIFAEDYFKSKYVDKSKIFEVKIIPLNTKDELDAKEKELIELYDSFYNGYNGTNGNS